MELLTTEVTLVKAKSEKTSKQYIRADIKLKNGTLNIFVPFSKWYELYCKADIRGYEEND